MSSCVPPFTSNKQNFQNSIGILLTGTSFQASDIHSAVIDHDALFILQQGGNILLYFFSQAL
jgi:hypothetical protein